MPTTPGESAADLFSSGLRRAASVPVGIVIAIWILAVAMHEASRLAASTPTASDRAYSLWDATGPIAFSRQAAWLDWWCSGDFGCTTPDQVREIVAPFVIAFAVLQFVLVLLIGLSFLVFFRPAPLPPGEPWRRKLRRGAGPAWLPVYAVLLSLIVNVLEIASIVPGLMGDLGPRAPALAVVITVGASLVWIFLLATLVALLVDDTSRLRAVLRRGSGPALRAIRTQRLAVIAVLVVTVMGTASGHGVLEQVPDIVRGWFLTLGRRDWNFLEAGLAIVIFAIVTIALWFIGRQRATRIRAAAEGHEADRVAAPRAPWIGAAIVIGAGAVIAMLIGAVAVRDPFAFIDWPTTLAVVAVLLALVGLSWVLGPRSADRGRRPSRDEADAALLLADILPALFAVALIVSLVKAYFGPLLLGGALGSPVKIAVPLVLMTGIALVVAPLFVARAPAIAETLGRFAPLQVALDPAVEAFAPIDESATSRELSIRAVAAGSGHPEPTKAQLKSAEARLERGRRAAARWGARFVAGACIVLALALFFPRVMLPVGPYGVMVLLVGAWIVVLANASMWLGRHRPLPVFEHLGLRTEPLLVIAILVPLVLTQTGGPAAVHALRNAGSDPLPDQRPTIEDVIRTWPAKLAECATELPGHPGSYVRPVVFTAAEGGGIRAAEWTWDVLDSFRADPCTRNAVAISSGVSGGAVGLALMHQNYDNPIASFVVGQSSVVTLAIEGLLVRDAVAALTGIRVPSKVDGTWFWEDRASLIESQWRTGETRLDETFNDWRRSPTGYIVFNSLAANLDCKVVVSQVDLNEAKTADGQRSIRPVNCFEDHSELSTTIDLVDYLDNCRLSLDWATAAMTAARFPYVTPAGRISGETVDPDSDACRDLRQLQLIDGGYFENSGLATFSDSAPQIVDAITHLNARADGTRERPFLVPVVMYIHNEPGGDVVADRTAIAPEIAVPVLNFDAGTAQSSPDAWLSRLSDELADVCAEARVYERRDPRLTDGNCDRMTGYFRARIVRHGIVVVAPSTTASLSVPLGWTLSGASEQQLLNSVQDRLAFHTDGCSDEDIPFEDRERFYATLGELMCALGKAPVPSGG